MRQVAALAVLACTAALSSGCGVIGGTGGQVVSYQGYGGTAIVSMDGRTITVVGNPSDWTVTSTRALLSKCGMPVLRCADPTDA